MSAGTNVKAGSKDVIYQRSTVNQSSPEPDPNPNPDIGTFLTNFRNANTPEPIGVRIPAVQQAVDNAVNLTIPGLSDTLSSVNNFIKSTQKPDFAINLLGLTVGVILSFLAISALLAEQNPIVKSFKR